MTLLRAATPDTIGTSAGQFLKLGAGARAMAMGEAYAAEADGSDAIYWNPAGLIRVQNQAVSFMQANYLADTSYQFASYANRLDRYTAVGAGVQYLSSRGIEQTDTLGNNIGTYNPNDLAVTVGAARQWRRSWGQDYFAFGVAGKFIRSRVVETAQTGAADFGFIWNPFRKLWLGGAAQNIGGTLKYGEVANPLPFMFRAGASLHVTDRVLVTGDGMFPRDNRPAVGVGTELRKPFAEQLWMAARLGINTRTLQDIRGLNAITAGMGLSWTRYTFDFAWVPYGAIGAAYRFSLSARFGADKGV